MFIIISKDVNFTYSKCNGGQILVLMLVRVSSWDKKYSIKKILHIVFVDHLDQYQYNLFYVLLR